MKLNFHALRIVPSKILKILFFLLFSLSPNSTMPVRASFSIALGGWR